MLLPSPFFFYTPTYLSINTCPACLFSYEFIISSDLFLLNVFNLTVMKCEHVILLLHVCMYYSKDAPAILLC